MECRVMSDLNDFEHNNDQLEKSWNYDLDDKRSQVVELAYKILNQDVDQYTFEMAFGSDFNFDDEDDFEVLMSTLAAIEVHDYSNHKLIHIVALMALDASAYCLYDIELSELLSDSYDEVDIVNEVLDGV